jgi:hypothetical protein
MYAYTYVFLLSLSEERRCSGLVYVCTCVQFHRQSMECAAASAVEDVAKRNLKTVIHHPGRLAPWGRQQHR